MSDNADNNIDGQVNKVGETTPNIAIVGIGASAGGLESIEMFLGAMQGSPGATFVIVQHLSPDFKSYMPEILSKRTELAVKTAEDKQVLKPNTIYLIPPNKNMVYEDEHLILSDIKKGLHPNKPIDIFFASLAEQCGPDVTGVVFSGTGSDGAIGCKKIYEAGGKVFVESSSSAAFDGMPNAVIATNAYTAVGTPAEIVEFLFPGPEVVLPPGSVLSQLFNAIKKQYGVDFTKYKLATIQRRLEKHVYEGNYKTLDDYWAFIKDSATELSRLYYELLIGVTEFFRDRDAFTLFQKQLDLQVLNKEEGGTLRIWVVGCATGEEAYSVAMVMEETLAKANKRLDYKIFVTDIDDNSLQVAAEGVYPEEKVKDRVPGELIERYFSRVGRHFHVKNILRSRMVFARHNAMSDAPFTRLDVVCCRNMLIYLEEEAQKRVLSVFYFSLLPSGILFLGPSESLGRYASGYRPIDGKWKLYTKTEYIPEFPKFYSEMPARSGVKVVPKTLRGDKMNTALEVLELERAYQALAENCLPPSMLINDHLDIHHIFGAVPPFTVPRSGRYSQNLRSLCEDDFCSTILVAIGRARATGEAIEFKGVKTRDLTLDVRVIELKENVSKLTRYYLLVAQETDFQVPVATTQVISQDAAELKRVGLLEEELQRTRQTLQSTIEELETTNEELQSTNEELLASNEELQSTNEELQSVNEELYSVNSEYQSKILEMTKLSLDEENLFKSIDIGTIFLDREQNIRKFSPAAARLFNLMERDVGRPFEHLSHKFVNIDLEDLLSRVIDQRKSMDVEAVSRSEREYLIKFNLYEDEHRIFDGVVISLLDITELKLAQKEQQDASMLSQRMIDNNPMGIHQWELNTEGKLIFKGGNVAANNILGFDHKLIIGKSLEEAFPSLRGTALAKQCLTVAQEGGSFVEENHRYEDKKVKSRFFSTYFQASPGVLVSIFQEAQSSAEKAAPEAEVEAGE